MKNIIPILVLERMRKYSKRAYLNYMLRVANSNAESSLEKTFSSHGALTRNVYEKPQDFVIAHTSSQFRL